MTKLIVSSSLINDFNRAKATGSGEAKKGVWARIRAAYAIPASTKLGVELDPASPNFGNLWVKDSVPRKFLCGVARFNGDFLTAAPAAKPNFAAADAAGDGPGWMVIERAALLKILRGIDYVGHYVETVPAGFPPGLGDDAVVLDSNTGNLYFRDL